jgi:hypothetical protein
MAALSALIVALLVSCVRADAAGFDVKAPESHAPASVKR